MLLNIISIMVFLTFFGYLSYKDLYKREISIGITILTLSIAFLIFSLKIAQGDIRISIVLSFLITSLFSFILFFTSGKADYKALLIIFFLFPFYPLDVPIFPLFNPHPKLINMGLRPFIMVAMENTLSLSLIYPLYNFFHNIKNGNINKNIFTERIVSDKDTLKESFGWIIINGKKTRITNIDNIDQINEEDSLKLISGVPLVTVMYLGTIITLTIGISFIDYLLYILFAVS